MEASPCFAFRASLEVWQHGKKQETDRNSNSPSTNPPPPPPPSRLKTNQFRLCFASIFCVYFTKASFSASWRGNSRYEQDYLFVWNSIRRFSLTLNEHFRRFLPCELRLVPIPITAEFWLLDIHRWIAVSLCPNNLSFGYDWWRKYLWSWPLCSNLSIFIIHVEMQSTIHIMKWNAADLQ